MPKKMGPRAKIQPDRAKNSCRVNGPLMNYTIPIKLKQCLGYKHHYQFQNVRPSKVLDAAQYLVHTVKYIKNGGIQVMDCYIPNQADNNEDGWSEFISKNRKETSENFSINRMLKVKKKLSRQIQIMIHMMSSLKQLNDHQVLWIHYCRCYGYIIGFAP